jgi:hypothetical protein
MIQKSRLILAASLVAAAVTGCRSDSGCRNGSCGAAPRYAPAAANPGYMPANPTYVPSDGSGSRSPVVLPPAAGGSRGEGSGSR